MWNPEDADCLRWAREVANLSLDPSTQVGAVLAGVDYNPRNHVTGVNRLPHGINRNLATMPREKKLDTIIHAEMDALIMAARYGYSTLGGTLYLIARDQATGDYWGGAPCTNCGKHLIHAGIKRVVSIDLKKAHSSWTTNLITSQERLTEAGIVYEEVPYDAIDE